VFAFILGIIFAVAGVVVVFLSDRIPYGKLVGSGLVLLGLFTIGMDSFTVVPARNVGIVNVLGKADQSLNNGFHVVPPWSSIETVDATVQNVNLDSDTKNCVTVRLANQTTACVDLTLQWNIDQNANANLLWQRYRGSNDNVVGNIGKNVVERELRRALNVVFEKYNPLAVLTNTGSTQVSTGDLASQALTLMRASVDQGIVVDTMLISVVHYDDVTQQKLNGYAQALADTQIATQQKLTAEQQKLANDQLAVGSSNDPGVKYQNCLNLLKDLAAKGQLQNLPPTFNCGDGSTPVIVGQK
jgi:hypothetical protein